MEQMLVESCEACTIRDIAFERRSFDVSVAVCIISKWHEEGLSRDNGPSGSALGYHVRVTTVDLSFAALNLRNQVLHTLGA